ncbi:transcription elongation factor subunit Spt4 [Pyrobaculum aerophilum]|uniref:Transcription elongation factor Spt4 n=1 Tax=Pyrobaculum aerophilum TaxID=13773 RepID=A0A371R4K1_9CREN|nr:transcription elongation factor subunit Spt4 [Pyrobaculum aerophilum]RFA93537.1 DNA-binding protein [Pyrobaculum aerophilum]RFA98997.1 DNA-binding protein [Pyrobaculum aerophilum]
MSTRKRTLSGYKACKRCKTVVPEDAKQCPNCGSEEFVFKWRGMIVVIDPQKSCIAKRLGLEKPGIYALELVEE